MSNLCQYFFLVERFLTRMHVLLFSICKRSIRLHSKVDYLFYREVSLNTSETCCCWDFFSLYEVCRVPHPYPLMCLPFFSSSSLVCVWSWFSAEDTAFDTTATATRRPDVEEERNTARTRSEADTLINSRRRASLKRSTLLPMTSGHSQTLLYHHYKTYIYTLSRGTSSSPSSDCKSSPRTQWRHRAPLHRWGVITGCCGGKSSDLQME